MLKLGKDNRRLDVKAMQEGRPVECPLRPGVTFAVRMAATHNPDFYRVLRDETYTGMVDGDFENRNAWLIAFSEVPEVQVEALLAVEGGIRGILDENDEEVEYTPEIGLAVLSDPAHADVRQWLGVKAREYGEFYEKREEADAGN